MNMIKSRMEQRGQGGFTLIELLVVVAILAVLAGAAIIGIGAMRTNAQKTACKSDKDTVETAAEAYKVDTQKNTYDTLAQLIASDYVKKGLTTGDFTINANTGEATAGTAGGKYDSATVTACNA